MTTDGLEGKPGYRFLPAAVVVFLYFAPQFAALSLERNRYFLYWNRQDTLAACASIFVLWLLGLGIGALVNRIGSPALRGIKEQTVVVLFGLGVAVNFLTLLHVRPLLDFVRRHRSFGNIGLGLGFAAILAGWVLLLVRKRPVLPRLVRASCLILSPLIPIVILPAIAWKSWYVPPDPLPREAAAPKAGTPVFMFVFDEWSFARATVGDDFDPDLPHLRALRAQSFFFRQARSPSRTTYLSIPDLLFQSHDYPALPHVFLSRSDFPDRVPAGAPENSITPGAGPGRRPESLFVPARRLGYATYLLGYYLPYRRILGDQVDLVRAYSDYPRGDGFIERMFNITIQNPHYWRLPIVSRAWKGAYAPFFSRHWVRLNERLAGEFDAVVSAAPERSFVFMHYPAPHAPFVYDANGRYRGPFPIQSSMSEDIDLDIMGGTPDDYHRNLRHLDSIVGRFLERLRSAGRYDQALIIMTSDHSWRIDPDFPQPPPADLVRHVPLVIKAPGQTTAETVDQPIDGRSLGALINLALSGRLDTDSARAVIPSLTDSGLAGGPGDPAPIGTPEAAGTPRAD